MTSTADITITCYKCSVTGIPLKYAAIRNTSKGKANKVAAFLATLARKGAFANVSDGPGGSYHGLETHRIEAFVAYCAKNGLSAA